jgi:serine/threonine protein kinase
MMDAAEHACQECGSLLADLDATELPRGTVIAGKYTIVEPIGAGGMGRVYRAIQTPLDVEVCIKTMHSRHSNDPTFTVRFEREARTTSQLRHPSIVTVFDFGTHLDGTKYLVMELIEGISLARVMRKGLHLPVERAVHIVGQVCDALTVAHGMGVIHRDLKPANIMLVDVPGAKDLVKVFDFGSSLLLDRQGVERLTQEGTVIGTSAYMAPEYLLGNPVDHRIDVYALGVLLYFLLCGSMPFKGGAQAVLAQQVSAKPEDPRNRNPAAGISPAMEQVVLRALAKDPARRFSSTAELKAAMEHAARETPSGDVERLPRHESSTEPMRIEAGAREREVVVVAVRAVSPMTEQVVQRITARGATYAATVLSEPGVVSVVFGLRHDLIEASREAVRFAFDVLSKEQTVKVGVHDAQASITGRPGSSSFDIELHGAGKDTALSLATSAAAGQVLVSGLVSHAAALSFKLVPISVSGHVSDPVFEVLGGGRVAGPVPLLPFVGRDAEAQALVEIAVEASKGHVYLLVGFEGIGKSRLVSEVASYVERLDVLWHVVLSSGQGEIGTNHPASLLAALGWGISDSARSSTHRFMTHLLLGRGDQPLEDLRGDRRMLRLVSAAISGIQLRREHDSIVVVLDDLHLADDLTWAIAQKLVETAPELKVNVVLCVREEGDVPFPLAASVRRIELRPLPPQDLYSCLASVTDGSIPHAVLAHAVRVARGHPGLAGELVRALRRPSPSRLDDLVNLEPIEAIDKLIRSRLTELSPLALRTLRAAALLGIEPTGAEMLRVAEVTPSDGLRVLMELEAYAFLLRKEGGASGSPRITSHTS